MGLKTGQKNLTADVDNIILVLVALRKVLSIWLVSRNGEAAHTLEIVIKNIFASSFWLAGIIGQRLVQMLHENWF